MKKFTAIVVPVCLLVFSLAVAQVFAEGGAVTGVACGPGSGSLCVSALPGTVAPGGGEVPTFGTMGTVPGSAPGSMGTVPGSAPGSMGTVRGSVPGSMGPVPGSAPGSMGSMPSSAPGSMGTMPSSAPGSMGTVRGSVPGSMVMQPGFTVPPSGQVDLSLNQNLNRTSSQSGTSPVLGGQSGIVALQQIQQQCLLQCQRNTLPQLQVQCQQQCQQLMQQQMQQLPQQVDSQKTEFGSDKSALPGNAKAGEVVELSEVERMMSNDTPADGTRIQSFAVNGVTQFGYSYFQGGLGGFASLSDVPVGPDYIVGTGDRIVMTAWGSLEGTYELDVNRNGEITLPRVGTVKVQGVSFGQLPGLLRKSLGRVFKDFELSVALGRVRLMKVYLVGDVVTPGDYIINSFSTVMNALTAAGGPTKNGTLRNIQIWREGKLAETIDLYDFFLKGDKSRDIRLQTGDTVFVPHIGAVAGIAGNVRRPAIYELKNEKTLKDLLGLANGVAPTGYLQRVQVNRVDAHNKRIVADFNIDPKADGDSLEKQTTAISIQDLDLVKVFHIDNLLRGYARLEGYVLRPGDYALRPGMKLAELLKEDNLLPEYADGTAELMRFYPPDLHAEVSYFSPAKALANDPAHNIELKEFDRVKLFSRWDLEEMPLVRVVGEVQWPGDYRLLRNMTVRELLLQAGNPKLTAYLNKAEVVRVKKEGGAVTSFPIAINLGEALKGNPQDNISLEALDELVVRRIPNWREETDRYVTINGEVRFPGTYPIFKGERLSDLILRTGGYTDKAYLFGAKFTRRSVQKLQQERMAEVIAQMEKNVTIKEQELAAAATTQEAIAATKLALDGIKASMQKMKTVKAEGRIAIRLEPLDRLKKSPADLELMGGDVLDIPQSTMAVTILGEVASPTTTIWLPGKDVSDYLDMAGGPTNGAETGEMYVIMADGSVRGKMSDGAFSMFRSGGFMSVHLHAGDTVVVPQKLERVSWMKELKDISQILANIAVTAGVPLAIIKR